MFFGLASRSRGAYVLYFFLRVHGKTMIPVAGMLLLTLALCTSVWAQSYDTGTHPQPYPAPTLPAAGGTLKDPTFGSTILRVTDASNAPSGVAMMSDAEDMAWNADGSLFLLNIVGVGYKLFGLNRSTLALTNYGAMNSICLFDGAQWHPTDPAILFCGSGNRIIYKFTGLPTNPTQTPTLVHDFTPQIPSGGYSSGRIGLSDTARYVMLTASSLTNCGPYPTGSALCGQDMFDYISIWDTQTSTATTLHMSDQYGAEVYLHSSDMVPGDTYVRLGGTNNTFGSQFWNWKANTFSGPVTAADNFSGHKSFGTNIVYNPGVGDGGPGSDTWLTRSIASPHTYTTLFSYPLKNNQHTYLWDSHGSKVLPSGAFVEDPQGGLLNAAGLGLTFVLHSGNIWKVTSYSQKPGTNNPVVLPPDNGWYSPDGTGPILLAVSTGIPTAPGQFWYDPSTDTLYVWLTSNENPNTVANIGVFPWVPMYNEIVINQPVGDGTWKHLRLCHHRAVHNYAPDMFYQNTLAHPDPQGRFVLFESNWGNMAGRVDAFIVDSQGGSPSNLPAPSNLKVQ